MSQSFFCLLHGAGLGAWIWRDLLPLLDRPAIAVDFPARDDEAARMRLAFDDYVDGVVSAIESRDEPRVVLVAHSISGVVALAAAERLGERLAGFVAIGAAIPADGGSFLSVLPGPQRLLMGAIVRLLGTKPPASEIRSLASDLDEARGDEVVRRFAPESRALYLTPSAAGPPRAPSLYVRLTDDRSFDVAVQDRMMVNLDPDETVDFESGHLPMLSRPDDMATLLETFAERL